MEIDPKSRALELILTLDLTVDELRHIQEMFPCDDCEKSGDVEPGFDWYSILKKMLERQCNLILRESEPIENEHISN